MIGEIVQGFKLRLEAGADVNYKVVLVEREYPDMRVMRMDVVGSEPDVKAYFNEWCADCVVRNTTTGLAPVMKGNNQLLSYCCVVDSDNRWVRMCDLNDSLGPDEEEEAVEVKEELTMTWDPDFEIVVRDCKNEVVLSGDGRRVLDYWQDLCGVCPANPDPEVLLPDLGIDRFALLACYPNDGGPNVRLCELKNS